MDPFYKAHKSKKLSNADFPITELESYVSMSTVNKSLKDFMYGFISILQQNSVSTISPDVEEETGNV